MGEFADDDIERLFDGPDDEYVHHDYIECRHCGLPGLYWEQNDKNRWKLVDVHGEVHSCRRYSAHAEWLAKTVKIPERKK